MAKRFVAARLVASAGPALSGTVAKKAITRTKNRDYIIDNYLK
ncbi:hypothetical protein [Solidesulfovibrio sp. C21]